MLQVADMHLNKSIQFSDLLDLSKDYCSDHLGRYFQNNYSPPAESLNTFIISTELATKAEQDCFAICVMMNNHIVDLKYFSDIFPDWDNATLIEGTAIATSDKLNSLINDQKLLPYIKSFKKINDEIVIGKCKGNKFIPF
ncbi:MAG: hypothetical protein H0W85_05490 [Methylotenera sp.]|nr:hypothetical protein [Methylotenera sp.]